MNHTALLAVGNTLEESKERLQQAVNNVAIWTLKNGKLNLTRPNRHISTSLTRELTMFQFPSTAKYLDVKLRLNEHVKKKFEELNIKFQKMYWFLERYSELETDSKMLLYKRPPI